MTVLEKPAASTDIITSANVPSHGNSRLSQGHSAPFLIYVTFLGFHFIKMK